MLLLNVFPLTPWFFICFPFPCNRTLHNFETASSLTVAQHGQLLLQMARMVFPYISAVGFVTLTLRLGHRILPTQRK